MKKIKVEAEVIETSTYYAEQIVEVPDDFDIDDYVSLEEYLDDDEMIDTNGKEIADYNTEYIIIDTEEDKNND